MPRASGVHLAARGFIEFGLVFFKFLRREDAVMIKHPVPSLQILEQGPINVNQFLPTLFATIFCPAGKKRGTGPVGQAIVVGGLSQLPAGSGIFASNGVKSTSFKTPLRTVLWIVTISWRPACNDPRV